jgi:hypothetical protein
LKISSQMDQVLRTTYQKVSTRKACTRSNKSTMRLSWILLFHSLLN